jgi:hypothetical protein
LEPIAEPACFFFTHALRIESKAHENLNLPDIRFDIHGEANKQQICDAHRETPAPLHVLLRDHTKHSHFATKLLLRSFNFRKRALRSSQCHA